jgi:protein-disulfide isomerase
VNPTHGRPMLSLPVGPRDHAQGPATAPVTLVEYGDYDCPHCARAYPIVKAIQAQMGDRLRFVFRNFPLRQVHPHAETAAEAAEAAAVPGKFWETHDTLYENQNALELEDLVSYAADLGLDPVRFASELQEGAHAPRVQEDFLSGVRSGVNGTPCFFLNDVRYEGPWDSEEFVVAIETVGKQARARRGSGRPR